MKYCEISKKLYKMKRELDDLKRISYTFLPDEKVTVLQEQQKLLRKKINFYEGIIRIR